MEIPKRISKVFSAAKGRAYDAIPALPVFEFARVAEIPVFIIHHGPDAEDYEILFDFDLFVAEHQSGGFSRPQLKIWAGRSDFKRHLFARRLRQSFAGQFDLVRAEIASEKPGWFASFSVLGAGQLVFSLATSLLSTVVLLLATSTGRAAIKEAQSLLTDTAIGRIFRRKSIRERLETKIAEKQTVIDEALQSIKITLHRELYVHAYRGQQAGSMEGIDFHAWPLPSFISQRIDPNVH